MLEIAENGWSTLSWSQYHNLYKYFTKSHKHIYCTLKKCTWKRRVSVASWHVLLPHQQISKMSCTFLQPPNVLLSLFAHASTSQAYLVLHGRYHATPRYPAIRHVQWYVFELYMLLWGTVVHCTLITGWYGMGEFTMFIHCRCNSRHFYLILSLYPHYLLLMTHYKVQYTSTTSIPKHF